MAITYSVTASRQLFFKNAYSYVRLRVNTRVGDPIPSYVALPLGLANDQHVQAAFEPAPDSFLPPNDIEFDVYFPLIDGMTKLDLRIFPQGSDPRTLDSNTQFFLFSVPLTGVRVGNAFLLGLENKEKNARVLPTANSSPSLALPPISYLWTGSSPDDISLRILDAIAHVTEEKRTGLIGNSNFTNNGVSIPVYRDPVEGGKPHLYFRTNVQGFADLRLIPGNTPTWGKLIYFPFAIETSEVARVVIFNPNILAKGFEEPVPVKNPVTLNKPAQSTGDIPIFNIDNSNQNIKADNELYLLINDIYDRVQLSSSDATIQITATSRFIQTSTGALPNKNDVRYLYVTGTGEVKASRRYAFFVFGDLNVNKVVNFDVALSGNNQIPRLNVPGTGRLSATYDPVVKQLRWSITYTGLSGPVVMAHFHGPALSTQNAPVIINIDNVSTNPITGAARLSDQQESQLLAGLLYCNLHTAANPGGEIRGQFISQS